MRLLLLLGWLLATAGCPGPAPADLGPQDLLSPEGALDLAQDDLRPDLSRAPKALLVHAGDPRGAAALRDRLALLGGLSQIVVFDAGAATPDALLLVSYDAVLVYSVGPFQAPDPLGDRLADFFDGGGGVVAAMLTTLAPGDPVYPGLHVGGRFRSGGYYALAADSGFRGREGAPVGMGKVYEPMSPLLLGVSRFSGGTNSFRPRQTRVADGASRIADWADGAPLVVQRLVGGRPRVDLGFFPPPDADGSGQNWTEGGDLLVRNALLQVARR